MFKDQYNDPRWLKRSAQIKERDAWTCQECGQVGHRLVVDHRFYRFNEAVWEARDSDLWTLCWECHEFRTQMMRTIKRRLGYYTNDQLQDILRGGELSCPVLTSELAAKMNRMIHHAEIDLMRPKRQLVLF